MNPLARFDGFLLVGDEAGEMRSEFKPLLANATLFFNAGRLDRSMELGTRDWLAVARPRVAKIAARD